jgi:hypothetical protein
VSLRPADTSPEAWEVFLDIQRRMTPGEKFGRALEWSALTRAFAEAGLRRRWPGADSREILLRYARLSLGEELFRKAYGDALPEDEPARRNS